MYMYAGKHEIDNAQLNLEIFNLQVNKSNSIVQ